MAEGKSIVERMSKLGEDHVEEEEEPIRKASGRTKKRSAVSQSPQLNGNMKRGDSSGSSSSGCRSVMASSQGNNFYSQIAEGSSSSRMSGASSNLFACPEVIGMSQYVGVSSLRHASTLYSFPRQNRFEGQKINSIDSSPNCSVKTLVLPSQVSTKACSFGFGAKRLFPLHVMRNASVNPSPDSYQRPLDKSNLKSYCSKNFSTSQCLFGLPYKAYAKTYVPGSQLQDEEAAKEIPGVGTYRVDNQVGENRPKYSIFGRPKNPSDKQNQPASNHYNANFKLEENSRFAKITFGKGNKYDFTKLTLKNHFPGPGTYTISSPFDQIKAARNKSATSNANIRKIAFI